MALIKGYSPVLPSCQILAKAAAAEVPLQTRAWCTRVPTASNVADRVSRLDFPELLGILPGAVWSSVPPVEAW